MKVKAEVIGTRVYTNTLGMIKIRADHAGVLHREGKYNLLEGSETSEPAKPLMPLSNKSKKELQEIAKDIPGFKKSFNKTQLIELINAVSKS